MSARSSPSFAPRPGAPAGSSLREIRIASAALAGLVALVAAGAAPAQTRVVRDGTVGPGASVQPIATATPTGVEVQIDESLGERHGANLFHSFQYFDVGVGDGVHFSADPGVETDHVISRVTGGDPSNILGQIRSSIPGADLYLLNPAGVYFGDGASLDVDGSLRVSTADTLVLGNGGLFDAHPDRPSLLRSAPPSAFGFLDGASGDISVDGSQLAVGTGAALWLAGANVDVAGNASLEAPGGSVAAIAVGDVAARIGFDAGDPTAAPDVAATTRAGRVALAAGTRLDASAASPGTVGVEAGEARIGGRLAADSLGDGDGGRVDVRVAGPLSVAGTLSADALSSGDAGEVSIRGRPRVSLESGALLSARSIPTGGGAGGDAGSVDLSVDGLEAAPGARIDVSSAPGSGAAAGRVTIDADHAVRWSGSGSAGLDFSSPDGVVADSGILAVSQGGGSAGSIAIQAGRLVVTDGAIVSAASHDGDGGGRIDVAARRVALRGGGMLDASTLRGDRGGDISVRADKKLAIRGTDADGVPSQIRALTAGPGSAGSVVLRAGRLEMSDAARVATVALPVFGDGDAGRIRIEAERVRLRSGAAVDSSTFGKGDAGRIEIVGQGGERADRVALLGAGTRVIGKTAGGGDGAEIGIRTERLKVQDGALLSTRSAPGLEGAGPIVADLANVDIDGVSVADTLAGIDVPGRLVRGSGGKLGIDASRSVVVRNASIESVAASRGDAGEIEIGTPRMRIEQGGTVTAATSGRGDGGRIAIGELDDLRVSGGSAIEASSLARRADGAGDAGSIQIAGESDGRVAISDSRIETSSRGSGGGRISIALDGDIALDNARIQTDVREGDRQGGDIVLRARSLVADHSVLSASATAGSGGAIEILVSDFRPSADTVIQSTSENGFDGRVRVHSPESLVADTRILPLDVELPDPMRLLRRACSARRTGEAAGELVVLPASTQALTEGWSFAWAPVLAAAGPGATVTATGHDEARRAAAAARTAALRGERADALADLAHLDAALPTIAPHERVVLEIHAAGTRAQLAASESGSAEEARTDLMAAYDLLNDAARGAADAGDERLRSYALGHLAELYRRENRLEEALFLARRARAAADRAEAADAVYRWSWLVGRVQWERGHTSEAIDALRRAVAAIEVGVPVATRFRRQIAPVYLDLARALLDASDRVGDPTTRDRLLREARAAMERLNVAELRDYFRDECVAALEQRTVSLDALSQRAAVVYPIVLSDRLELLVSLGGRIGRYTVAVGSNEVKATARRFRAAVENRLSTDYLEPARQLYDWLVRPYAAAVRARGVHSLVFVPGGGALAGIPLAALRGDDRDLSDDFAVAVEPGLALLDPRPLRRDDLRPVLAGLSETVDDLAPLTQVPKELEAIHALYGGEVLLNDDFRIRRFAAAVASRRPALLHVASHMTFTGDVSTSFLMAHDGRLSLEEFASIVGQSRFQDEPVELLMLSACETAAGDSRAAFGLAGMAVRAGARSVVGSLWTVDDAAARALVVEFYRQLRDPAVGRAEALRRAQQSLRRDPSWSHPYYWSAFQLVGDWE